LALVALAALLASMELLVQILFLAALLLQAVDTVRTMET
jgi:hypothetical protein